jgi:hypothetical protein
VVLDVVEGERELARQVLEHRRDRDVDVVLVGLGLALDRLGLRGRDREAARDGLGHVRPADVDLAAEARLAAAEDVDRRADGADVDERDPARLPFLAFAAGEAAELPRVREREQVDVDRGRGQAQLLQELDPLLDRLLLASREERSSARRPCRRCRIRSRRRALERLAVEHDLLELERKMSVSRRIACLRSPSDIFGIGT